MSAIQLFDLNGEQRFTGTSVGGGGSQPSFVGVSVGLASTVNDLTTSGDTVPFDRIDADSDGYWDAVNHQVVVPVGRDGYYLLGMMLVVTALGPGSPFNIDGEVDTSGNPANAQIGLAPDFSGPLQGSPPGDIAGARGSASAIIGPYSAGDTITPTLRWGGGGTMRVLGGANGSLFWCEWRGPAA